MFRFVSVLLISLCLSTLSTRAEQPAGDSLLHGKVHFETCMAAALQVHSGIVIKVEMKRERGSPVYEFDIRDNSAQDWDIECNADTAEIIEVEQEVTTPRHPAFQAATSVSEQAARKVATDAYPGRIEEIEYEIEHDGVAVYEFDIRQADGKEMKVEINAATGEVHEANQEFWQIGYE